MTDDDWALFEPGRASATEHECFRDCGFFAEHLYYAIKQANLRVLALHTNWMYVRPEESYLIRLTGVGCDAAWVSRWTRRVTHGTRKAEDTFWIDDEADVSGVDWDLWLFVKPRALGRPATT